MRDLFRTLEKLRSTLDNVMVTADAAVAAMQAGNVRHSMFDQALNKISELLNTLDEVAAEPGIGAFLQKLAVNEGIDLAGHRTAIVSAAETVAATIRSSAPTGAQSFVLAYQYDANPRAAEPRIWRTYTPTQTATIQTQLADLSNAISNFFRDVAGQPQS